MCKGGQVVLFYYVDRIWPHAYFNQHKFWYRPPGLKLEIPNEVSMIMEKPDKMIIGDAHMETGKKIKIINNKPGLCWNNYLSGEIVLITRGVRDMVCCKQLGVIVSQKDCQKNTCTKREQSLVI